MEGATGGASTTATHAVSVASRTIVLEKLWLLLLLLLRWHLLLLLHLWRLHHTGWRHTILLMLLLRRLHHAGVLKEGRGGGWIESTNATTLLLLLLHGLS